MSINHTDKTEITAPIAHHLEQQLPALVTDNNGHWQKFTILNAADLLDGTALKYKLSIGEWQLHFHADLDFELLSCSQHVQRMFSLPRSTKGLWKSQKVQTKLSYFNNHHRT